MKKDKELKFTIIGLGHLMEEVFPCISSTVGSENLRSRVNATTADELDHNGKEERLGIDVYLNDNLKALKALEPDIIFFAPPPDVAPALIQSDLKRYFDYLRAKSAPIPEIFAFPPVPDGDAYLKVLGEDLLVVRIMPSSIKSIGGVPIQSIAMATFERSWPELRHERVLRIWSAIGGLFEVRPSNLLAVLTGGVMAHATPELVLAISDILGEMGFQVDYRALASCMRAVHQQKTGFTRPESLPCSLNDVEGDLCQLMDHIIWAWYQGIVAYMQQIDLKEGVGEFMIMAMLDMMLWLSQAESREDIEKMTEISATAGGILEKALLLMKQHILPAIRQGMSAATGGSANPWEESIADLVKLAAEQVHEHGKTLADG